MSRTATCLAVAAALAAALLRPAAAYGAAELRDLRRLDAFRALVNRDADTPRLVLLMSPT
jgi:hypothetical protein